MGDKDGRDLEFFKKYLKDSFSLFGGIHVGFGEKNGMFIGRDFELRKSMFPEKLHIIPMLDDSVFDGIPEFEHASFTGADIITHVDFRLVAGTRDDDVVLGPADTE